MLESYMLKVAGYVDDKMQALSKAQKPVNKSNIAILLPLI
jgi:cell division protein ZapA (FtsZ GTPase activity inhibitor)